MYGYFKDVRVWAEVRNDPDLYTYRVRQINILESENLMANFKFMNGR